MTIINNPISLSCSRYGQALAGAYVVLIYVRVHAHKRNPIGIGLLYGLGMTMTLTHWKSLFLVKQFIIEHLNKTKQFDDDSKYFCHLAFSSYVD